MSRITEPKYLLQGIYVISIFNQNYVSSIDNISFITIFLMLSVPFLLYLTTFFISCLSCQSSPPDATLPHHMEQIDEDFISFYEDQEEEEMQCDFTLVAPKIVINPYKSEMKNVVPQKPFGSFYLKCTACLAVAHKLMLTINDAVEESEAEQKCQEFINEKLTKEISELCTHGFKNYDLRKFNDNSLITDKYHCTDHVKSNMDGIWTKKLREICRLYTSHMDLEHISNNYAHNTQDLTKHLCWGSGIFRDCQNIETNLPIDILQQLGNCTTCGDCCVKYT